MDLYKIGVAISLQNGMSPVLAVIAKDLFGIHGSVREIEHSFRRWNTAIAGAGAALAGAGILEGLNKIIDHGQELVHVQEQLAAANVSQQDIITATAKSWELASKYGVNVSKVLSDIKETRMVFGSTEHAINFIDPLEKMRVVLNSVTEGSGDKSYDAVYSMARSGELKGVQTPEEYVHLFDAMTKAITASGGKVDPRKFLQATQYGKLARYGWSEEFYTKFLPSVIQEGSASTGGQSLMSAFSTFVGGIMASRKVEGMRDLGMVADESKIHKIHGHSYFDPGAWKGTDVLLRDPFEWANKFLKPAIEKATGVDVMKDKEGAITKLATVMGNRNTAAVITDFIISANRYNKDAAQIEQSKGLDAADRLLQRDPTAVMNKFTAAWDNLLTAIGKEGVSAKLDVMIQFTKIFDTLTSAANAHPEAMENLIKSLGYISGFLLVLGAGFLFLAGAAAAAASVPALIAAFVASVVALAFVSWDRIKQGFDYLTNMDWSAAIHGIAEKMKTAILALPGEVSDAIKSAFASIAAMIKSALSGIASPAIGGTAAPHEMSPSALGPQHHSSLVPPSGGQHIQVASTLNVDGRRLADATSYHVAKAASWPDSAGGFDGRLAPTPVDYATT